MLSSNKDKDFVVLKHQNNVSLLNDNIETFNSIYIFSYIHNIFMHAQRDLYIYIFTHTCVCVILALIVAVFLHWRRNVSTFYTCWI